MTKKQTQKSVIFTASTCAFPSVPSLKPNPAEGRVSETEGPGGKRGCAQKKNRIGGGGGLGVLSVTSGYKKPPKKL